MPLRTIHNNIPNFGDWRFCGLLMPWTVPSIQILLSVQINVPAFPWETGKKLQAPTMRGASPVNDKKYILQF